MLFFRSRCWGLTQGECAEWGNGIDTGAFMKIAVIFGMFSVLFWAAPVQALQLFEDFKNPGRPHSSGLVEWSYRTELLPVKGWLDIVPGDGFAHIEIDAKRSNDRSSKHDGKPKWPFQMIKFSAVGPGHRIEMRAKNTVIPGVASFIFTYKQVKNRFDEIDIEIVGNDAHTKPKHHPTDKSGWTDVRFNAWANANAKKLKPEVSYKKPIRDKAGHKVSHSDGEFHIYTIEWRRDRLDFLIDGVHQQTITKLVPDRPATVLVGVRHMSWTGKLDWEGRRTMLVDWIRVEPIK